jgi:hypothetical protein
MMVAFAGMAFAALFGLDGWSLTRKLLFASLMALPLHQFEEYELPGGGPIVINRVFWGEREQYLHYPGNWNSIMIVNLSAYFFYIAALILPNVIWLGLATMLFNLFQVLGHCFQMNIKGKTWYNPGMATSIFLFLPISIVYIRQVSNLTDAVCWIMAVAALVVILLVSVILPVQLLKKRDSGYYIPEWQNEQFEKNSKKFHI